jgi:glutamate formiminotransferase / formiminotetrahydrofolate cyclodeaminase
MSFSSQTPLVAAIPNFSEGRRPQVIEAILHAIQQAAPVAVLDHSSDGDHNRSVITFAGAPQDVAQASIAAIKTAAQLIDMRQHQGSHPRVGANDVVPFVPLHKINLEECITLAHHVGQRVGQELGLPVYLYEAAAQHPERKNLEDVRRGEYETLRAKIGQDPSRAPDFGPSQIGKAGAVIIGAREMLIAFNVFLTTDDLAIAKNIAKAIRYSNGGLRYVKALGMVVDGRAQVSINLTNYLKTPIHRVVEMIRREAARYGTGIAFSELIGLIPEMALVDSARWYMQLDRFSPQQTWEYRLQEAFGSMIISSTEEASVKPIHVPEEANAPDEALTTRRSVGRDLAYKADDPTDVPSAVLLLNNMVIGLADKVARLSTDKQAGPIAQAAMQEANQMLSHIRATALGLPAQHYKAIARFNEALKVPSTDKKRNHALQAASEESAQIMLETMHLGGEIAHVVRNIADRGTAQGALHMGLAAHVALAAVEGGALAARSTLAAMPDRGVAESWRRQVDLVVGQTRLLCAEALALAETRGGLR